MLQNSIFIVLGLIGLYAGGTLFVSGAAALARRMGMSSLMVGLTVVAIGTSLPELIVSMGAALSGQSEIALGNVIGSNIANVGFILGVSGIILPLAVQVSLLRREIPLLLGVSVMTLLLMFDGQISRIDGAILLAGMGGFLTWTVITSLRGSSNDSADAILTTVTQPSSIRNIIALVAGLVLLLLAARLTVSGATGIARGFGVSELIIGITLVAIGTSLPELVTSVTAALQKQSDIAVGNVVGSNLFNLLGILGGTAVVSPIPVATSVIRVDALVMIGFAVMLLPFLMDRKLNRIEALLFLGMYIAYTIVLFSFR
jgi:cation:H+ antiporter